jgi:hypothetical protein
LIISNLFFHQTAPHWSNTLTYCSKIKLFCPVHCGWGKTFSSDVVNSPFSFDVLFIRRISAANNKIMPKIKL